MNKIILVAVAVCLCGCAERPSVTYSWDPGSKPLYQGDKGYITSYNPGEPQQTSNDHSVSPDTQDAMNNAAFEIGEAIGQILGNHH